MSRCAGLALSVVILLVKTASAFEGEKTIYAEPATGDPIAIGTVSFTPNNDTLAYSLDLDEAAFTEHFLSMRPFKCLEIERQTICHLPYPYELQGEVKSEDWRDLEYRLLFLFKNAGDYGINFANGYYFHFDQEGDRLVGRRFEVNMDQLASPPPEGIFYPLDPAALYESEGDSHRLQRLIVK